MANSKPSPEKAAHEPVKVLLIEDEPNLPELIGRMLEEGTSTFPFELSHVDRLSAGIEYLREKGCDVVLLDLGLPDSYGTSGVYVLRAEAPHAPLVVLTGADDEGLARDALCAGAQDYLVKGHVDSKLLAHTLWSAVERHRLTEHLRMMSLIDELTGLHNRRGFEVLAVHQLRLADRYGRNLLLLFVDIDGLKRINDAMGHHQGDSALVEAATALRESFRGCDIMARWGGDEFVVLTSECLPTKAETLIERLTSNLWLREISAGLPYELRITVGCAPYDPANPCTLGNLIRQADEDMCRHKAERRVVA